MVRAGGHQPEEGRGGSEAFIPAFTAVGGGKGKERVGFGDYGKGAEGSYLEGTCSRQVFELGSQCHVTGAVVPCLQDEGGPRVPHVCCPVGGG